MKAILLCAGYATRLRPLTDDCPKHLLEVKGKPILSHVVDKLAGLPLDGIYVVTNNKFFTHFEAWHKDRYHLDFPLKVLNDGTLSNEDRLGSVGDINFVLEEEKIDDDIFLVNADNIFTFDLLPLFQRFLEKRNVIALYDVKSLVEARKMGAPVLDGSGKVVDFVEKPDKPTSSEVSIGLYLYSSESAALIRTYLAELAEKGVRPDTTGDFVAWLSRKMPVYTHAFNSASDHWIDIGTPEQYENAKTSPLF
jgi:glucose-1-phosphate thymidylyltransferase